VNSPTSLKKEWVLTKEALDTFLARLDVDQNRAGQKYETVRRKLLKYFEWCGSVTPDIDADETINRVARKIQEGEDIYNLNAYIYGVARIVNTESLKIRTRNQQIDDEVPEIEAPEPEDETDDTERRVCFDRCLQSLTERSREIIIGYYQYDKNEKIEWRRKLAAKLGMTRNALRIAAHRTRAILETCVRECQGNA
jgi:RNA polymerase sigma factor (sigma-70 family)